jgi:UDP-N-acetylglucosamine 2-epimerase
VILIYYANRAEKSILDPIKLSLDRRGIKNLYVDLSREIENIEKDINLSMVYDFVFNQIENIEKCNGAIVIGDRREIMFASLALFVKEIPIIQLASGDLSEKISLVDDYFRHLITILSSIQIGFTENSRIKSDSILENLNLDPNSKYFPNPTLSDISVEPDASNLEPYDLILVHPQSLSLTETQCDVEEIIKTIDKKKKNIVIRGNKDKNYTPLYRLWKDLERDGIAEVHDNLEKSKFISILAGCDRFITNSSCAFYEAPIFLEPSQILHIGKRNKNREIARYNKEDIKSSDKIVDFIVKRL